MRAVELLRRLQEIDSALDADRDRLAAVEARLADRSEVLRARHEAAHRATAHQQAESSQRDLELQVGSLRERLETIEKKLYGGRVGSARELTDLNTESTQLRGVISEHEDRLLELFDASDQAGAALAAAEAHLRDVEAKRRQQEAELSSERGRLIAAIKAGEDAATELRGQLEPPALRTYDNLRRSRGGLAVAEVRQRTCQGCRVSLPASEEQRARHGDALVLCQSCGRILYASL